MKNSCKCYRLNYIISDKDIICYKIFKKIDNKYYGPFTNYLFNNIVPGAIIYPEQAKSNIHWLKKIFPGIFNKNHFIPYVTRGITYDFKSGYYHITSGFIHTLPYNIEGHLKEYVYDYGEFELWECIIPKGTLLFKADARESHYEARGTYASKCIKLIKKIDMIK